MIPRYAIIVAGGSGTRMGTDIPKQFLDLDGKSILRRSIERFTEALEGVHIITVLPKEHIDLWKVRCLQDNFIVPQILVAGGITRFHSVKNALAKVPGHAVVGVHDGVRPFPSIEVIRNCYETARTAKAVIPVIPVVETLRHVESEEFHSSLSKTVPRSDYRLVQTPQTFDIQLLKAANQQPYNDNFTDDASVVESYGYPITLVEGNRENIKITTPYDLKIAEVLIG